MLLILLSLKVMLPNLYEFLVGELENFISSLLVFVRQINNPGIVVVTQVNLAVAPLQTNLLLVRVTVKCIIIYTQFVIN